MIRCRRARRRIESALENTLAMEARLELEAHLATCAVCGRRQREARTLQEWLEGPGDPAPVEPDLEAAVRAVFARLDGAAGVEHRRPGRRVRFAAATVALAAVLALVLRGLTGVPEEGDPAAASPDTAGTLLTDTLVRAALLESFRSPGVDLEHAQARFLLAVREPARAGWPIRRFVEKALDSPELELARAAARCLGAGRDPGAALVLERSTARSELASEALAALGELARTPEAEEPAVAALARALEVPTLAPTALRELCRVGGARVATRLERLLRTGRARETLSRETLLDALTTTGPEAVASLLRLAEAEPDEPGCAEILARLALVPAAGEELARLLARESVSDDLAYSAIAVLRAPETVPWLEARVHLARERAGALAALAGIGGPEPLEAALRLALGGRVSREDVLALLVGLLEEERERAERFSSLLAERAEPAALHAWLTLLIESEHAGAARALLPLVFAPALPAQDREWAALALGELGAEHEAGAMARLLKEQPELERRLGAACLVSIHAHLGAIGVEDVLAACPRPAVGRVLEALASNGRAGGAVQVHRVARALDSALARSDSLAVKEIL